MPFLLRLGVVIVEVFCLHIYNGLATSLTNHWICWSKYKHLIFMTRFVEQTFRLEQETLQYILHYVQLSVIAYL